MNTSFSYSLKKIPDFPSICRFIAHNIGSEDRELAARAYIGCWMPYDSPCICFQSNQLSIVAATDSLAVHLVKKDNNNPVLGVDVKGKVYRWHGEIYELQQHLLELLQFINGAIFAQVEKFQENRKRREPLPAETTAKT